MIECRIYSRAILFLFGKNTLPKSIDFDGVVHRRDKNVSSI